MPEEPVKTVQAWFDAWNARDFDVLRTMYSPAAAYLRPDGFSQGLDPIVSYLRAVASELRSETAVVDAVVVGPDVVAVEWTARGPEDQATRARMASFFRFQDGKILSHHEFGDPTRSVRLLAARCGQAAAPSVVASPGETMVATPSPLVAMPAPQPVAAAEPQVEWGSVAHGSSAQLRFESGPDRGVVITLGDQTVTLGRALDNDFVLQDPCTSGHHARLERQSDKVVIVDLGSTNGTSVNGMQVQRSELREGDRISIGGNAATFAGSAGTARGETSLQPISA